MRNTIITASDQYYFSSMCQLIFSYGKSGEGLNSAMICYDLGLTAGQIRYFKKVVATSVKEIELRPFDFRPHPYFVRPEFKTYSWKPLIIETVVNETRGNVLWMDSANIILKPLTRIWHTIETTGSYLPVSGSGTLAEWTHPQTLKYLHVPEKHFDYRNRCGGLCGFSYENGHIKKLVAEWAQYALVKECIKPEGANRSNHRDDQSLLSILLYKLMDEDIVTISGDEVNISSANPIDTVSVRNKVPRGWRYSLNFASVTYFSVARAIDILINRLKAK